MRVAQRLRINSFVSAVSVLVIFVVLFLMIGRVYRALEAAKTADAIIVASFERLMLRTDFDQTGSERSKTQLIAKHKELGDLLKEASTKFSGSEDKKIVNELFANQESIDKILKNILESSEKRDALIRPDALSQEIEDRRFSQLNMRVYESLLSASKLQASSKDDVIKSLWRAGGGIFLILLSVSAATLVNSRIMGRSIAARVARLCEGATVIGAGDLNHLIDIKGDDEFVELSEAFNAMTAKLRGSYLDLENEIEERRRAEEALHQQEERLRLAMSAARMASWDWNVPSGEVVWNDTHYRMMGYEPGEVQPSNEAWASRVHPDDREAAQSLIQRCMNEKRVYVAEFRTLWPDGTIRWLEARGDFEYDTNNQPLRNYGVMLDITDRKQVEELLHESRADLARAQEVGGVGSWRLNVRQNVLTWSDENYRIFGIPKGTPLSYESFLDSIHPDDRMYVDTKWMAALGGEPYDIEHRIVVDGKVKWVREKAFLELAGPDNLLGGFGITQDITQRKEVEEELRKAHDELEMRVRQRTEELAESLENQRQEMIEREKAEVLLHQETLARLHVVEALREKEQMLIQQSRQAAMGEMIGNIAHQWRQPLNALGLFTQRLGYFYGTPNFNKELLDTSIAKSMEIIQHMSKTIDDFSDYFKPDKEKTDFRVGDAIKNTLSLLEGSFQNPRIRITIEAKDNPVINGFQNEFAQVLLNILINARDAILEREIVDAEVTITISSEDGSAVVTISDNAGGIPEAIIDKVFDPYFSTKGPQKGTGVGLFMSKAIIEKNMGGKLTVRNTDAGAEFRIEV